MLDQFNSLAHHLGFNHFPPVGEEWIPACEAAIEAGNDALAMMNDEYWEQAIDTPNGPMPANTIIEGLHLDFYLHDPWNEPEEGDDDE